MSRIILTRHPGFHDPAAHDDSELQLDQITARDEVAAKIADGSLGMVANPCVCGCVDGELVAGIDRYGLRQDTLLCPECGIVRSDRCMDDDALSWFYGSDIYRRLYSGTAIMPPDWDKFIRMAEGGEKKRDVVLDLLGKDSFASVAEMGCGAGWNLYPYHQNGSSHVVGCDFSPELTAFGRTLGMDIRQGDLSVIMDRRYDLVILSHVLEHMPDPLETLRQLRCLLAEGGSLYIEVPDLRAFCFDTLQSAHLWYFTPDQLTWLAAQTGLRQCGLRQMGPHFAMVFSVCETEEVPVHLSAVAIRALIRAYDRRQRFKHILVHLGVFGLAHKLLRRLRG